MGKNPPAMRETWVQSLGLETAPGSHVVRDGGRRRQLKDLDLTVVYRPLKT